MKRRVSVVLRSRSEELSVTHHVEADLYVKDKGKLYIRYTEPDPSFGATTTILKVQQEEAAVIRQGDFSSEQSFVPKQRRSALYRTPHGTWQLENFTHYIDNRLVEGIGTLRFSYDLFVEGEPSGTYEIEFEILEEAGQ